MIFTSVPVLKSQTFDPTRVQEYLKEIEEACFRVRYSGYNEIRCPLWWSITPGELFDPVCHLRGKLLDSIHEWMESMAHCCRRTLWKFPMEEWPRADEPIPELEAYILEMQETPRTRTLPEVFLAYMRVFQGKVRRWMRSAFDDVLKIGLMQRHILPISAIDWAAAHSALLLLEIKDCYSIFKSMCGDVDLHSDRIDSVREFPLDADPGWESWRAPRFIRMLPLSDDFPDPKHAWDRQNESETKATLLGLRTYILKVAISDLESLAGDLRVQQASSIPAEPYDPDGRNNLVGQPLPQLEWKAEPMWHSEDYTRVTIKGKEYSVTILAGSFLKLLDESPDGVTSANAKEKLQTGSESKPVQWFRQLDGKEVYKELVESRNGKYYLKLASLQPATELHLLTP